MRFITVYDGVVTGVHSGKHPADFTGTPFQGHQQICVPDCADVASGNKCACYNNKTWMKRPLKELAKDGLFQVPRGKIIDGDALRNMTETEKYAHGIDIPEHNKFENGRLVPKTPAEMVADGEMTALEAAERRLAMELAKLNNEEARLRLEIDEGYAEVRKNKLRALLAVREQAGWPESVEWPA